jgi:alpha-beta hydrolase superfamily lysophospholipase
MNRAAAAPGAGRPGARMGTDGTVLCLRSTVWAGLPVHGELVITDDRGLVLFVHGLWVHPDARGPWIDEFDRSGYDSITVRWPDEAGFPAGGGQAQMLDSLTELIGGLDRRPIVAGHGFGGLLA